MPPQRPAVDVTADQRVALAAVPRAGAAPAGAQTRARRVLKADQGAEGPRWQDARIAEAFDTSGGAGATRGSAL